MIESRRNAPKRGIGNRRGFTLLEVVAALAVVSLVAVSALAMVTQQLRSASHARRVMQAQEMALARLNMMRMLNANDVSSLPDTIARGRYPAPDNDFTWRATSRPVLSEENLYDIDLEIAWNDGSYRTATRLYAVPAKALYQ